MARAGERSVDEGRRGFFRRIITPVTRVAIPPPEPAGVDASGGQAALGRAAAGDGVPSLDPPDESAIVVLDPDRCVVWNGTGLCGACYTVCHLKDRAILEDHRGAPTVIADECDGCGRCEEYCIVAEPKALRVPGRTRPAEDPA